MTNATGMTVAHGRSAATRQMLRRLPAVGSERRNGSSAIKLSRLPPFRHRTGEIRPAAELASSSCGRHQHLSLCYLQIPAFRMAWARVVSVTEPLPLLHTYRS